MYPTNLLPIYISITFARNTAVSSSLGHLPLQPPLERFLVSFLEDRARFPCLEIAISACQKQGRSRQQASRWEGPPQQVSGTHQACGVVAAGRPRHQSCRG